MTLEEIIESTEKLLTSFPEEAKKSLIQILRTTYNAGFNEGVKRAGQVQDFTLGKIFGEAKG